MPDPVPGGQGVAPNRRGGPGQGPAHQGISGSSRRPLRVVPPQQGAHALIAEWLDAYPAATTRKSYHDFAHRLLAESGTDHPAGLSEASVIAWCTGNGKKLANNSVRGRISVAIAFLRWCNDAGHTDFDTRRLAALRRKFPKTYGKVQSTRPARWLTHEEAFGRLVAACQDETTVGLRDELIVRLGLSGLRVSEIGALTLRSIDLNAGHITWTAKGNRPRRVTIGSALRAVLNRYLALYAESERFDPRSILICRQRPQTAELTWGAPYKDPKCSLYQAISGRATAAGLGHVAPHDLRRSAAGILHRSTTPDGGHRFDLLDIQKVLGHADPATTMRSYLDPMDTGVMDRAAAVLD